MKLGKEIFRVAVFLSLIFCLSDTGNAAEPQEVNPIVRCDLLAGTDLSGMCWIDETYCIAKVGIETYDMAIERKNWEEAVTMCRKALVLEPDNPVIKYQLGRALKNTKNPDEALPLFQEAAVQGHIWAMYEYSATAAKAFNDYEISGREMPEELKDMSIKDAVQWNIKAAELGNTYAQFQLARLYLEGSRYDDSVPVDMEKSLYWLKKSAQAGNPLAQFWLGLQYQHGGLGLKENKDEAAKWYELSYRQGNITALHQYRYLKEWPYLFYMLFKKSG